ncbi:MAG: hypothetical protein AAFV47_11165 [Pseudomonadota bacterium]
MLRVVLSLLMLTLVSGCASSSNVADDPLLDDERVINDQLPAPQYGTEYWSAIRACQQTGRSVQECQSGADRGVSEALAVEERMRRERAERRAEIAERAKIPKEVVVDDVEGAESQRSILYDWENEASESIDTETEEDSE